MAKLTYYAVDLIPVKVPPPDVIAKHTAHLRDLDNEGRLVLAGPFADDPPGGLLILNCGDKAAADAIMSVDPLDRFGRVDVSRSYLEIFARIFSTDST